MAEAASEKVGFKRVNLSRLSDADKRVAWEWMKENEPNLAKLISGTLMQDMAKAFDGEIIVELPEGS
jgi:uncharacterized Zn finger protein